MSVIWVLEDALGLDHPVFAQADEDARAVFVFDAAAYERRGYSLKRLVFIMECVEAAGFEVIEGDRAEVLRGLGAERLYMARTPDPELKEIATKLRQDMEVHVVKAEPFVRLDKTPDVKRFFRYWKTAKKHAFDED